LKLVKRGDCRWLAINKIFQTWFCTDFKNC